MAEISTDLYWMYPAKLVGISELVPPRVAEALRLTAEAMTAILREAKHRSLFPRASITSKKI
jgi:hypothetical protein